MNPIHRIGALGALLSIFITVSAHAALIGVLPATPSGSDWQAYYDTQLDITWTANADINGAETWDIQVAAVAGLNINGVTGWRLPNMDVNGDDTIVDCFAATQASCKDNEYGHLFYYGAGSVSGSGITPSSPGPFSNIQSWPYWSGTESALNPAGAWLFNVISGSQEALFKNDVELYAWGVHSGDVGGALLSAPVPAAGWLFGSGLIGLLGLVRRKR